ncbi:H-NS family nucleoid-associated regulatory protein [Achromobacter ruhlandii]|uniref:H-NS histone family protein n=1 Tax=Achromobacter ruhlandii TaxID=72557 RepID=UPI003BA28D60
MTSNHSNKLALAGLSIEELNKLRKDIDRELQRRAAQQDQARKQILELAELHGVDLASLTGAGKRGRSISAAKYRNPENMFETWSGLGRKPKWVVDALEGGATLQSLEARDVQP